MTLASVYSPRKPYLAKLNCYCELAKKNQQCWGEAPHYFIRLLASSLPGESGLMNLPREMQREFVRLLVAPGSATSGLLITLDDAPLWTSLSRSRDKSIRHEYACCIHGCVACIYAYVSDFGCIELEIII